MTYLRSVSKLGDESEDEESLDLNDRMRKAQARDNRLKSFRTVTWDEVCSTVKTEGISVEGDIGAKLDTMLKLAQQIVGDVTTSEGVHKEAAVILFKMFMHTPNPSLINFQFIRQKFGFEDRDTIKVVAELVFDICQQLPVGAKSFLKTGQKQADDGEEYFGKNIPINPVLPYDLKPRSFRSDHFGDLENGSDDESDFVISWNLSSRTNVNTGLVQLSDHLPTISFRGPGYRQRSHRRRVV